MRAVRAQRKLGRSQAFIVTPDGYAFTNSHVAGDRTQLAAETTEGDKLRAEIEGQWGGKPPSPEKYIDLSYYDRAMADIR